MLKRTIDLLEKEILTEEEFQELEKSPDVVATDCCGLSGRSGEYQGCTWYDVTVKDGERFDVYIDESEN